MKKPSFQMILGMLMFVCMNANAELMRDYYSEPGIQEYKGLESQYINESVDAFGGTVQLHFKDAIIPGNGGLDIVIQRSYKSHQRNLMYPQFAGLGWTMHYGRITVPVSQKLKVCEQDLYNATTRDNPSLELPDGSAELLMLDNYSASPNRYLITKTNWLVTCRPTGGFDVRSPDGTTYIMDKQFIGETQTAAWYTSLITDKNGNTLSMSYGEEQTPAGVKSFLQGISASDGRNVSYNYSQGLLSSIQYGNSTLVSYSYAPTSGSEDWLVTAYDLVGVSLPASQDWEYEYYPKALEANGEPEPQSNQLKSITYPSGAKANYEYQKIAFDLLHPLDKTHAISRKTLTSSGAPTATWLYEFIPGPENQTRDKTIITGPESVVKYEHYGVAYVRNGLDASWMIGLPAKREVYSGSLIEKQQFHYEKQLVSDEDFWHGRDLYGVDNYSYKARMISSYVERDEQGASVIYENFDAFGNPGKITKQRITTGVPGHLEIQTTYINDTANWIIGLPDRVEEVVVGGVSRITENSYDSNGNLVSQEVNGVVTSMSYDSYGNLSSRTEPGSRTTQYSSYQNGVAQSITNPDQTSVSRSVDNLGRITSITDENGNSRSFSYDGIGRLTGISYPEGAPVSIVYGARSKTLTRGGYFENTDTDGWGRVTSVTRNGITVTNRYSPEGHKIFTSYPESAQGTEYDYDGIGRQIAIRHPDGAVQIINDGAIRRVRDERGNYRELLYQNFGTFDGGQLIQVIEENVTGDDPGSYYTTAIPSGFGHATQVRQGVIGSTGEVRTYDYDSRFYLISETNPETGVTTYTRDSAGNMKSKTIGGLQPILFDYDERNRLTAITYPEDPDGAGGMLGSSSVSYEYDNVGNVKKTIKGNIRREFEYSNNGNLTLDRTVIDGTAYNVSYGYTALDHLDSITYPSGRVVNYLTDALGRASQIGDYVVDIAYHPSGQVSSMTYANGVTAQVGLNSRRLVSSLHAYGQQGDLLNYNYGYDQAQNITAITDNVDPTKSRAYSYDELNRMITADTASGVVSYGYNRNDGLVRIQSGSSELNISYVGGIIAQKQWRVFQHDQLGNITSHAILDDTGGGVEVLDEHNFVFDHSGSLRQAQKPSAGISVNYAWTYDAEGMRVVSEDITGQKKYFIHNKAGQLLGEYKNGVLQGKETIYLGDQPIAAIKGNEPPVNLTAGPDLQAGSGDVLTITPSATDPESRPITYTWQQTVGEAALINVINGAAQVTMPVVLVQQNLTFRVTATDEKGGVATDDVVVDLLPPPPDSFPIANIVAPQSVMEGYSFVLDGSSSTDAEGPITYSWHYVSGPFVSVAANTGAMQQLVAPSVSADSVLKMGLTVTDQVSQTNTKTVNVSIINEGIDADADGLPDGWEMFFLGGLASLGVTDTDADGISNLQEYSEKTNPNVAQVAPVSVTGLKVLPGDKSAFVEWEFVKSTAKYTLYWSQTPSFDVATASKLETQNQSVNVANLTNGKTYYFKVVASNTTGSSAPSAEVNAYVAARAWNTKTVTGLATSNKRGQWVELVNVNFTKYMVNLYDSSGSLAKAVQVSSTRAGVDIVDIKASLDDLGNIGLVWWEANYLMSSTINKDSAYPSTYEIGCFKSCVTTAGRHNPIGKMLLNADQSGNFLLTWLDEVMPSVANDYTKLMAYRLKPGMYPNSIPAIDEDIASPTVAIVEMHSAHTVTVSAAGEMLIAWPRTKESGTYLRVAKVDLRTMGALQLLNAVSTVNASLSGGLGLSANGSRISVYWESGSTFNGRDWSVPAGTWGANYPFPNGGLATPQKIINAGSSSLYETSIYTNTKNSLTTVYANSRTPTGAWSATATTLGSSFTAAGGLALSNGEHLMVGYDANGLGVKLRSATGTWGAWTSIKVGEGVVGVDAVEVDLLGNIKIFWRGSVNGRQMSEFKPAPYVPDTAAPVTTIATTRRTSKGKVFMDCTLTANEAATTYFRVTGAGTITAGGTATTSWQTYSSKVTVQLTGTATIEYYSVDAASNTEATKSGTLQ